MECSSQLLCVAHLDLWDGMYLNFSNSEMQCDFRQCFYRQMASTHVLDMGELFLASGSANSLYHLTITLGLITMKYNSFW